MKEMKNKKSKQGAKSPNQRLEPAIFSYAGSASLNRFPVLDHVYDCMRMCGGVNVWTN
jgi:hypothetical protein